MRLLAATKLRRRHRHDWRCEGRITRDTGPLESTADPVGVVHTHKTPRITAAWRCSTCLAYVETPFVLVSRRDVMIAKRPEP